MNDYIKNPRKFSIDFFDQKCNTRLIAEKLTFITSLKVMYIILIILGHFIFS